MASINRLLPTGSVMFCSLSGAIFRRATRISVTPGTYDVLIGYQNLEKLSEDGLDGDDSDHLFLALKQEPPSEHGRKRAG